MQSGYLKPEIAKQIEQNHPGYLNELQELKDDIVMLRKMRDDLNSGNSSVLAEKMKMVDSALVQANKTLLDAQDAQFKANERMAKAELKEKELEQAREKHLTMLQDEKDNIKTSSEAKRVELSKMEFDINNTKVELNDREKALALIEKNLSFQRAELEANQKAFIIKNQEFNRQSSELYNKIQSITAQEGINKAETNKIELEKAKIESIKASLAEKEKELASAIDSFKVSKAKSDKAFNDFTESKRKLAEESTLLKAKITQADERLDKVKKEEARVLAETTKLEELKKYILKEGA